MHPLKQNRKICTSLIGVIVGVTVGVIFLIKKNAIKHGRIKQIERVNRGKTPKKRIVKSLLNA